MISGRLHKSDMFTSSPATSAVQLNHSDETHTWVHNLEKGDPLINMSHAHSTEEAIEPILRGATVNER